MAKDAALFGKSKHDILDETDEDVEDGMKIAAKLVMGAGIVPDIIVTTMLDELELAYGVAILEMHVAAMSLKKLGSAVIIRGEWNFQIYQCASLACAARSAEPQPPQGYCQ